MKKNGALNKSIHTVSAANMDVEKIIADGSLKISTLSSDTSLVDTNSTNESAQQNPNTSNSRT